MPVLQEDRELYSHFASGIATKIGYERNLPQIVWHYTSAAGLLGILEKGSIYATQLACLNDQTELRYAVSLLRNALSKMPTSIDPDVQFVLELLAKSAGFDVAPDSPFFVACFSEHIDDLSQWRAYGGGENGYAIGFRTEHLFSAHSIVARVNYDRVLHEEICSEVAAGFIEFYRQGIQNERSSDREIWILEFALAFQNAFGQIGPMLKDEAFKAEGEIRCIHHLALDESSQVLYRQKSGLLARHLPLHFPPVGRPKSTLLPIVEVMIGPCRHPGVSLASIRMLLQQSGYGGMATATTSRIPFQVP